jgi:hypothetical protein
MQHALIKKTKMIMLAWLTRIISLTIKYSIV